VSVTELPGTLPTVEGVTITREGGPTMTKTSAVSEIPATEAITIVLGTINTPMLIAVTTPAWSTVIRGGVGEEVCGVDQTIVWLVMRLPAESRTSARNCTVPWSNTESWDGMMVTEATLGPSSGGGPLDSPPQDGSSSRTGAAYSSWRRPIGLIAPPPRMTFVCRVGSCHPQRVNALSSERQAVGNGEASAAPWLP
jgi:hypothetical protein